jgi:hypothetical protein
MPLSGEDGTRNAPSSTGMRQRRDLELVPVRSDEKMRRGAGLLFSKEARWCASTASGAIDGGSTSSTWRSRPAMEILIPAAAGRGPSIGLTLRSGAVRGGRMRSCRHDRAAMRLEA